MYIYGNRGVGKRGKGENRLLKGSEILLGRWRIMGGWRQSSMDVLVYSLFQLHPVNFHMGYCVCPLSFVIPTTRPVPYPDV